MGRAERERAWGWVGEWERRRGRRGRGRGGRAAGAVTMASRADSPSPGVVQSSLGLGPWRRPARGLPPRHRAAGASEKEAAARPVDRACAALRLHSHRARAPCHTLSHFSLTCSRRPAPRFAMVVEVCWAAAARGELVDSSTPHPRRGDRPAGRRRRRGGGGRARACASLAGAEGARRAGVSWVGEHGPLPGEELCGPCECASKRRM